MFKNLESSLESSLSDFSDAINFAENSFKVRPRLSEMLAWDSLDESQKKLAQSFIKISFSRPSIMYCALFVAIHATYEQYIRDLVEASAKKLNATVKEFNKLDDIIAKNNIKFSGSILATIHQPLDYYNFDYHDICRAIGTCYPGSKDIRLNPTAFSFSAGAMTPKNIESLFNRIKITINWDIFGRNTTLKTLFNLTKTRDTTKAVKDYVEDLTRNRNRIAHTGATVTLIDESFLKMQIRFIREFSKVLTSMVK